MVRSLQIRAFARHVCVLEQTGCPTSLLVISLRVESGWKQGNASARLPGAAGCMAAANCTKRRLAACVFVDDSTLFFFVDFILRRLPRGSTRAQHNVTEWLGSKSRDDVECVDSATCSGMLRLAASSGAEIYFYSFHHVLVQMCITTTTRHKPSAVLIRSSGSSPM